jgi:SOS response regulatory protein OraA/RecX
MISDYLKKYSNYYLSRYSVTKKKFEDILKNKIEKDFFQKKINNKQYESFKNEVQKVIEYFEDVGVFNEKRLLEITFQSYVNKGYSKKKILHKIENAKFEKDLVNKIINTRMLENDLTQILIENYLKKSKIIEKQKKTDMSDKQLFDKIITKLAKQGFDYYDSKKILTKIIS